MISQSDVHSVTTERMIAEKRRVAMTSVIAAVVLTGLKLAVGLWTGSLGILSEAAHSGLDLLAAGITFFAIRIADRPPDTEHHFGHGKVENLSALAETLLLLITCGWILTEAFGRLSGGHHHVDVNIFSFIVIGISIVVDIGRSRALARVAKKYHSQALEADALHFQTDIYSSLVVIVGLICVQIGWPEADAIAAMLVAGIVIWISLRLGKRTIDVLLDRTPSGAHDEVARELSVIPGVERVHSVRVRQSGAMRFFDVIIGIDRTSTFDQAHQIMDAVEAAVARSWPRSSVIVHAEPVVGSDDSVASAVSWLVQQTGMIAHNIVVLDHGDGRHVELDIEYPSGTSFTDAHVRAEHIRRQIRDRLAHVSEVHVHIEERGSDPVIATDVTAQEQHLLEQIRLLCADRQDTTVRGDIRCFHTESGLTLSLTCALHDGMTLQAAHAIVSQLETGILALDSRIAKVFIHAEPAGWDGHIPPHRDHSSSAILP